MTRGMLLVLGAFGFLMLGQFACETPQSAVQHDDSAATDDKSDKAPPAGLQCVGTLSKLGPDVIGEDLHVEPASGAEAPAPEVAERVNGIRAQHSGLEVAYS